MKTKTCGLRIIALYPQMQMFLFRPL